MSEQPRPARRAALWALLISGLVAATGCDQRTAPERTVMVYAAASLRDALFELADQFRAAEGIEPKFNLAGSNVLALQIDAAPAADVYLSADEQWMDFLAARGRIDSSTRRTFLSNRLVIVVNRDHPARRLDPSELADPAFRFVSMADPEAVPAGRYARAYLAGIRVEGGGDLWSRLRSRVAPAPDVRAALGLVEAEPDIAGIVYRTDARASPKVREVYEVPPLEGPEIRYAAALVADARNPESGRRFLEFLQSPGAQAVFEHHGFTRIRAAAE